MSPFPGPSVIHADENHISNAIPFGDYVIVMGTLIGPTTTHEWLFNINSCIVVAVVVVRLGGGRRGVQRSSRHVEAVLESSDDLS